jgi:hypothetical protein
MDWLDQSSFEIRGRLDDNVHSVSARLVIGFPDFVIRDAHGEITRMPYQGFCEGAYVVMSRFVGQKIGRGFRRFAAEVLGGGASCHHLHTLVTSMSASAFQMNYLAAKRMPEAEAVMRELADDPARKRQMVLKWMPVLRNSCFVFSEASDALFDKDRSQED